MKITNVTLARPIAAGVLALSIFVVGLFSLKQLEVDFLPDITYPMIKVHIWWQGATPEEIETNIAEPVERVLSTIDNLDYLESSSIEGMYTLLVNFEYGVAAEVAYQDVIAAMGRVARELPDDMEPPVVIKADPSQLPVMQVTVSSQKRDLVWLRDWCDNWLQDRIVTVHGTAGVEIVGGLKREIRVHLEPDKLLAYRLSPAKISQTLYEENREIFAGRVTVESREIIARTMGEFESLDEIRNIVVAHSQDGLVYLKDIATVEDSHEETRVITRFNGQNCVKLSILKQAEANTVRVAGLVREKLEQLKTQIPEDIDFGVVENQGDYVTAAIKSVRDSAMVAAILVIFVTYVFLGHWRQVVVMVIVLPLTVVANFFLMNMAGFSLNIFSLGGLVVAMGVVLDNSIITVENITRLKKEGLPNFSVKALEEVGPALFAATLSYLALFLPFLLVPGMITLLFKELVLTIAGIVIVSLLLAITITPLVTDRLLKNGTGHSRFNIAGQAFDRIHTSLIECYGRLLAVTLKLRWLCIAIAMIILLAGIYLAGKTGSEMLPNMDDGRVMIKVKLPAGTAVSRTNRILNEIEKHIADDPLVKSYFTMAGGKVWGLYTYEIAEEGEINIQLVPKSKRKISTQQYIAKLRPVTGKMQVPGCKIAVMSQKVKGIRAIGVQEVEVKVKGNDIHQIYDFAQKVAQQLNRTEGLAGINLSMNMTKPEYRIYIDRTRASALQIPVRQIAETLRSLVHGTTATQYRDGSEYYNIRVMIPESKITEKTDLDRLILENKTGEQFYLRDVAEVRRAVGPVEIVRENQAKQVIVRADSAGISVGQAIAKTEKAIDSLESPVGVYYEMGGQAQMMADMKKTVAWVLGFAVFFAFVVLAVQFESLKLPLLILGCLPVCLTGLIFGLYTTGLALGATVAIGLLVVVAATINDGVLLLTFAEQLRTSENLSPAEAALTAGKIRFRPRIMTTLSTIAGLIPLALNLGEGADLLVPMAAAAIGGLVIEIFVALFLMPAAYVVMTRKKHKIVPT